MHKSKSKSIKACNKGCKGVSRGTLRLFVLFIAALVCLPVEAAPKSKVAPDSVPEKDLPEVVVRPGKRRYSKRSNPAVDLMESIRRSASKGDPRREPAYSFDSYERIVLGLANMRMDPEETGSKAEMLRQYADTSALMGYPIVTLSYREKGARRLFRADPKAERTVVTGQRSTGIDESFNQANIQTFLNDVLRPIDIYSSDITLMQQRFVSPLAPIAADYYMYFITDTVTIDGMRCVELTFAPHSPESFSFNGKIYVNADGADSTRFVKRVSMRTPSSLNVNYLEGLRVEQTFERDSLGNRHVVSDDMAVELRIIPGTQSIYAGRAIHNSGFSYETDPFYDAYISGQSASITLPGAYERDDAYWSAVNPEASSDRFDTTATLMEQLRRKPFFRVAEKVLVILVDGYVPTGKPSKVNLGPVNTLFSLNTIEGWRFRVGGMTTAALSPRWFGRAYLAYGTRDRKFKYYGELEYSFTDKKKHSREFPMHSLRLSHKYDLDFLGQHYLFTNTDNVFLSWKRRVNDKATYRRLTQLEYFLERRSGFSLQVGLRHEMQYATRWIPFVMPDGTVHDHYSQAALRVELRYAPGETFMQAASMRVPVNNDAPVIILSHEYGPRGFLGAPFATNKTELSAQKRFWFSSFGYFDLIVKGSKMWSKVWYPALLWQNANLTYTIQPESYPLLNPMEFALDQYVSWDATYWGNGILFNRIPLVKKLKMREVVGFRGFWGSLTKKNNPALQSDLPLFPADAQVGLMGKKPYMEISVGLDNILTFIRLDYVWRLTYRDTPGADRQGLRFALHFTF